MATEIRMPLLSDTMNEGRISAWNKKIGDFIQREDVVAEIDTDKATMELVGYEEGTILYLNGKVGDVIPVNDVVAIIGYKGEDISKLLKEYNLPEIVVEYKPIFISYSSTDSDFALKLAQDLRSSNESVWIDKLNICAGEAWDKSIQKALRNSECVVIILSKASTESDNVLNEIHYAIDNKKRVVPVLLSDCELPFSLYRIHYIDFRVTYETAFARLLNSLKKT